MSSCCNFINFAIPLWSLLKWKFEILKVHPIILIYGILWLCNKANAQQFTRSCQDPLIQNHITTGHTYCFHACGYLGNPSTMDYSSCTAVGNCLCNYPCDSTPPTTPFDTNICPPIASEPADPDPAAVGRCTRDCASRCPGGQGSICGESLGALGPNRDVYAKICTCYCPPQPCSSPTNSSTSIAIFKSPIFFLIKTKLVVWKTVFNKIFKVCLTIFKFCLLYFVKLLLIGLYYYAFYEWISWETQSIFTDERFGWDFWFG